MAAAMEVMSNVERAFILASLAERQRVDGRRLLEMRQVREVALRESSWAKLTLL